MFPVCFCDMWYNLRNRLGTQLRNKFETQLRRQKWCQMAKECLAENANELRTGLENLDSMSVGTHFFGMPAVSAPSAGPMRSVLRRCLQWGSRVIPKWSSTLDLLTMRRFWGGFRCPRFTKTRVCTSRFRSQTPGCSQECQSHQIRLGGKFWLKILATSVQRSECSEQHFASNWSSRPLVGPSPQ